VLFKLTLDHQSCKICLGNADQVPSHSANAEAKGLDKLSIPRIITCFVIRCPHTDGVIVRPQLESPWSACSMLVRVPEANRPLAFLPRASLRSGGVFGYPIHVNSSTNALQYITQCIGCYGLQQRYCSRAVNDTWWRLAPSSRLSDSSSYISIHPSKRGRGCRWISLVCISPRRASLIPTKRPYSTEPSRARFVRCCFRLPLAPLSLDRLINASLAEDLLTHPASDIAIRVSNRHVALNVTSSLSTDPLRMVLAQRTASARRR